VKSVLIHSNQLFHPLTISYSLIHVYTGVVLKVGVLRTLMTFVGP
jgi:hypothetical protein